MKQPNFRRLVLIAAFAIFTIVSAAINYCFGWKECDIEITHPELSFCPICGGPLKEVCEIWHDGVDFHIHTYQCVCGFWDVYYN